MRRFLPLLFFLTLITVPLRAADSYTGNNVFIGSTTMLGLGYYGLALSAIIFDPEPSRPFLGAYMQFGAASFYIPYFICRDPVIPENQAWLYAYGGLLGIGEGFSMYFTLLSGIKTGDQKTELKVLSSFGLLTGLGLSSAAYYLAGPLEIGTDDAHFIGINSIYGYLSGFGLSLSLKKDSFSCGLTSLLLSTAAATGSYFLTRNQHFTMGDINAIYNTGFLGCLTFLTPYVLGWEKTQSYQGPLFWGIIGTTLGLTSGYFLSQDKDFTDAESGYLSLCTYGGTAIGFLGSLVFSFPFLFDSHSMDYLPYFWWFSTLAGSAAGYIASYRSVIRTAAAETVPDRPAADLSASSPAMIPLYISGGTLLGAIIYNCWPKKHPELSIEFNPGAVFSEYEVGGQYTVLPFFQLSAAF